jgi:tRNA A-37 threonylcarbamoyl transferase component Bud32
LKPRHWLLLGLLLLGVALPAGAQLPTFGRTPDVHTVTFQTEPAGATITLDAPSRTSIYLGRSGEPVRLDLGRFTGQNSFSVTFSLYGYAPLSERIESDYFRHYDRFPASGRLRLEPAHPWSAAFYWWRSHRALAGMLGGTLLLAACLLVWRERRLGRLQKRTATLESMTKQSRTDAYVGSQLATWRLVEKLGEGGSGAVYRAVPDDSLDESQAVAIKLLTPDISEHAESRARFEREVRICCQLVHPNIVHVLTWGEQEGLLYLVMELVKGQSLRAWLLANPGGLELSEASEILLALLRACHYAHEKGIVHRDLKPENVMLAIQPLPGEGFGVGATGERRHVKIVDFGVARAEQQHSLTRSGDVYGTLAYLAPERLQKVHADHRSDQYAVGIMAYEMLSGQRPFGEAEPAVLVHRMLHQEAPTIRSIRPGVPVAVSDVVARMLKRDLDERFADAGQAAAALEQALAAANRT